MHTNFCGSDKRVYNSGHKVGGEYVSDLFTVNL